MIMDRLKGHPDEVHSITRGLTPTQLKQRTSSGKWSVHEVAMHVCEVQDVHIEWLSRMLTEDKPHLSSYAPDDARRNGFYLTQDFGKRLAEFDLQRTTMTGLLQTLTSEQWALEGIHPGIEHYTIKKAMESLMRHEEHHLYQMYELSLRMHRQE